MTKTMTKNQRLMAVEAALVAAECCFPREDLRQAVDKLQKWLCNWAGLETDYPTFGEYLKAQQEACLELACNPQVFGGEPDFGEEPS